MSSSASRHYIYILLSIYVTQKEEKIRILKQRLAERDQAKGDTQSSSQLQLSQQITLINNGTSNNQGKEIIEEAAGLQIIIQNEPTTSDFDSAYGNGYSVSISACTRSSEVEFSERYL